jgi:formate dehydrogenase iron-sulfur subunit
MADMAILVDTTRCTACRGCQVACKQWNCNQPEGTEFFGLNPSGTAAPYGNSCDAQTSTIGPVPPSASPGYQNPVDLSYMTYRVVRFFVDDNALRKDRDADGNWNFISWACFHCLEPLCVDRCAVGAMKIDAGTGFVYIDPDLCTGCMDCAAGAGPDLGCPWDIPKQGRNALGQLKASKCHGCFARVAGSYPPDAAGNSDQYQAGDNDIASKSLIGGGWEVSPPVVGDLAPACVTACPTSALQFGDRADVLAVAYNRATDPEVLADFPNACVFGNGDYGEPETRVIMVLNQDPSYYKAKPAQVFLTAPTPPRWWFLPDLCKPCP